MKKVCKFMWLLGCLFLLQAQAVIATADDNTSSPWMIARLTMSGLKNGWSLTNFNGLNTIMSTNDGGAHWATVSPKGFSTFFDNDNPDQRNIGTAFIDERTAWVAQVGTFNGTDIIYVYHTINRGKSWTTIRFSTPREQQINKVFINFTDLKHGYILTSSQTDRRGEEGKSIYTSDNGGKTWILATDDKKLVGGRVAAIPSSSYVTGFEFNNILSGWVTTTYFGGRTAPLYHTVDGGTSWVACSLQRPASVSINTYITALVPIFFDNNRRVGITTVCYRDAQDRTTIATYSTIDGGDTWSAPMCFNLSAIGHSPICHFRDLSHGWMWTSDGLTLLSTTNAGHDWTVLNSGRMYQGFYTPTVIDFITARRGWAVVRPEITLVKTNNSYLMTGKWVSFLFFTDDAGKTWKQQKFFAVNNTPHK